MPDHFITAGLTDLHTNVLTEGYPKPGEPNPIANLLDLRRREPGRRRASRASAEGDWYTYAVQWSPDGKSLLFNRTNRHQNVLHVMAADPETGATRIVVTETQPTWQDNRPVMQFLEDGQRFIWETREDRLEATTSCAISMANSIATLTQGEYPVAGIEKIDEANGVLYYTAYSDPTIRSTRNCIA